MQSFELQALCASTPRQQQQWQGAGSCRDLPASGNVLCTQQRLQTAAPGFPALMFDNMLLPLFPAGADGHGSGAGAVAA
jgi:hypothetical protein